MLERTASEGLARLRLAHGKVSALDLELLEAFSEALRAEEAAPERALVLTGTGTTFSAGVDLARILDGGVEYTGPFLAALAHAVEALFTFPKPVIAAVNGHAIAGGCILALAADYVVMAEGRGRIGVPELQVGVPFPPFPLEVLRARLAPAVFQRVALRGELFSPTDALALGLIDAVCAPEALDAEAGAMARALTASPARSFALTKALMREPSVSRCRRQERLVAESMTAAWRDEEVLAAVRQRLAGLKR